MWDLCLTNDLRGRSQPIGVGAMPGQMPGCYKKPGWANHGEQVSKCSPLASAPAPASRTCLERLPWLSSVMDWKLWNETSPFLPKLLLGIVSITAAESNLRHRHLGQNIPNSRKEHNTRSKRFFSPDLQFLSPFPTDNEQQWLLRGTALAKAAISTFAFVF